MEIIHLVISAAYTNLENYRYFKTRRVIARHLKLGINIFIFVRKLINSKPPGPSAVNLDHLSVTHTVITMGTDTNIAMQRAPSLHKHWKHRYC